MENHEYKGPIAALLSFCLWGLFPLYWRELVGVEVWEVFFNRVAWLFVSLIFITYIFERQFWSFERLKSQGPLLLSASVLIGVNWFTFIWAVANDYVIETSIGYFTCPIFKVFLGNIFFGEKMNRNTVIAVCLAITGILPSFFFEVRAPWIAIALAVTFSLYGLAKKKITFRPYSSLLVESGFSLFLFILINSFLGLIDYSGFSMASSYEKALLVFSFFVTLAPLYFYAIAATNLDLSTLGFFQYIAPIGQFSIGYFVFKQNFTIAHGICFAFIIPALLIFSMGKIRERNIARLKVGGSM